MTKSTSILLGDYFEEYVNSQVKSGKYASASDVIRAALKLFEREELKRKELIKELDKGEKSGFVEDFNKNEFLQKLQHKYNSEK